MKRTPPEISKARQVLGQEMAMWKAKLLQISVSPKSNKVVYNQQVAFCNEQLFECRKRMASLGKSVAHRSWAFKD
jgi:hypothetical protein